MASECSLDELQACRVAHARNAAPACHSVVVSNDNVVGDEGMDTQYCVSPHTTKVHKALSRV